MTTTGADEVLDAEVLGRAATLRARAAGKAKAGAARGRRAAAGRLKSGARRLGRGLAAFSADLVAYWGDIDGALDVEAAAPGDPTTKAKAEHEAAKRRHHANVVCFVLASLGWCSAGWTALAWTIRGPGGWGVVAGWWLILTGISGITSMGVWKGKHKDGWLWPSRLWGAVAAAAAALFVHLALDRPAWQLALAWLVPILGWLTWAASDGEVFGDGQPEALAPAEVARDNRPNIVQAVLATGALKADATPLLVQPGVLPGNNGTIWTAAIDTGGQSATVFLERKPRAELAARLDLSEQRLLLTVDKNRGQRLHLTGIVGKPFPDGVAHPLLSTPEVDLWQPLPFGTDVTGAQVGYTVPGANALFGGESGAGKSVAVFDVVAGFALSRRSRIWAIDGGEVDTEVLNRTGLAAGWTTERKTALQILREVLTEVERRQNLLGAAGDDDDVKVTPEWMAEHDLGHDLLLIDELATFTQDRTPEARDFMDLLRPIAQRCRKTGIHLLLSTQSPSADAIDPDARDVIPVRWCGRARSVDLAGKALGKGTVGRGVDPRTLPEDVEGVGWFSTLRTDVVVRPYFLTRRERRTICDRGADLRRAAHVHTAADDDRLLAARVAELIKAEGVTVGDRRVMLARDVAVRFETDQMQLRAVLGRLGIGTQKVWRPDDGTASNRAHYVLTDFPAVRAI